jgi:hypothetical protein
VATPLGAQRVTSTAKNADSHNTQAETLTSTATPQ